MEKIRQIELCERVDPNPPPNSMATVRIVKSLKKNSVLPDVIENKMVELKDQMEEFKDTLVPPILNAEKFIKDFSN